MRAYSLAFAIAAAWTALSGTGVLEGFERLTAEARFALRPAPGYHSPVTIVAIDERALARYGQMPWDRRVFARLLDKLKAEQAAVVGIDVAFNEPAHDTAQDAALVQSLKGVPTVLPTFLAFSDAGRSALTSIEPLQPFVREAAALGSIQLSSEQQTEVWEVEPYQNALGRWVPVFPIAVAAAYRGQAWTPRPHGFPWRRGPELIDYRGPANSAPQVSAVDLLDGHVAKGSLKGRMVLVGAVATGLPDTNFAVPDPRHGPMAGVELYANVIDNALSDGFLRRLGAWAIALLLMAFALFPGVALCRGTRTPHRTALALGAVAAWSAIAVGAFWAGVWLEVVPVVGFVATCFVAGLFAERTELLESRNQLLGRYASDLATEAQRQRARIEGELHDGIQQLLIVMAREVRAIQKAGLGTTRVEFLGQLAEQAQAEIKRLRGDLLPPALRYGGLPEALPALASEKSARSGIDVRVEVVSWEALPREREVELYWLVNEAINNAEKHARPSHVRVRLETTRDTAVISVTDDGQGFTPPDLSVAPEGLDHSGLHRMWLRMRGAHGDLHVESAPGAGTSIRFSQPLESTRSV